MHKKKAPDPPIRGSGSSLILTILKNLRKMRQVARFYDRGISPKIINFNSFDL